MKSRRKIWFAPLAALALVMVLAAMVFAQTPPNAKPTVGPAIPDAAITIIATEVTTTVDLTADLDSVTAETQAAFNDEDILQYTAMSSAPRVVRPSFASPATFDNDGIVDVWWDSLGGELNTDCRKKAARLGFSLTVDGDDTDTDPDNAPAVVADQTAIPPVAASDAAGMCQTFADLSMLDDSETTELNEGEVAQLLVVQAFHWDMLSGAEMIAAATAGGLSSPSAYGARFADLSPARRANVETLYTTRAFLREAVGF